MELGTAQRMEMLIFLEEHVTDLDFPAITEAVRINSH